MNAFTSGAAPETRAVVLGGGGITGIAWEVGVVAGLLDEGIDLSRADAIIGTSAGAFVATYLAAKADLEERYDDLFTPDTHEIPAAMSARSMEGYGEALKQGWGDARRIGTALGRMAREAETVSTEARSAVVAHRLPTREWPEGPLMITAIDAETGELHVLDKDSGIPLATAAAASGAVPGLWPVVSERGRHWIDGGSCSPTNAILGAPYDRVIVISPAPDTMGGLPSAADDVKEMSARSRVELLTPDARTVEAIGDNVFDPSRRGPAAEAGRLQGRAAAAAVRRVWAEA